MTVYTMQEACDYLRIKRNTLYKLIDSGKLKTFMIGRRRLTTSENLEEFVRAQQSN